MIADVLIHALQTATCTRPDESRGYHSLSCGADLPGLLKFRRCFPSANAIHLFLMPQLFLHPQSTSKIDDTDRSNPRVPQHPLNVWTVVFGRFCHPMSVHPNSRKPAPNRGRFAGIRTFVMPHPKPLPKPCFSHSTTPPPLPGTRYVSAPPRPTSSAPHTYPPWRPISPALSDAGKCLQ